MNETFYLIAFVYLLGVGASLVLLLKAESEALILCLFWPALLPIFIGGLIVHRLMPESKETSIEVKDLTQNSPDEKVRPADPHCEDCGIFSRDGLCAGYYWCGRGKEVDL